MNKKQKLNKGDSFDFEKGNFDMDSLRDKLIILADQNIENNFLNQQIKLSQDNLNEVKCQVNALCKNQVFLKIETIGPIYWTKMSQASTSQSKWQSEQTELKQIKKPNKQNLNCNGNNDDSQTKQKDVLEVKDKDKYKIQDKDNVKVNVKVKKDQEQQEYSQTIWKQSKNNHQLNKHIKQNFSNQQLDINIDEEFKQFLQAFLVRLKERLNLPIILNSLAKPWLIIAFIFGYAFATVVILYFWIFPYFFSKQLMSEDQMNIFQDSSLIIVAILYVVLLVILAKSWFKSVRILHQEIQKINICFSQSKNYFQNRNQVEIQYENNNVDNVNVSRDYKLLQDWKLQMNKLKSIQLKLKQSGHYKNCFQLYQYVQIYQKRQ